MIDDQYGLGFARNAPDREYLDEALTAIERGRRVDIPATEGQGCLLNVDIAPVRRAEVCEVQQYERVPLALEQGAQLGQGVEPRGGCVAPAALGQAGRDGGVVVIAVRTAG